MNTCPNCGKPVEEAAGFCGSCGAPITPTPPPESTLFCPHCGENILANTEVCPNCGKAINPSPTVPAVPTPPGRRNRIIGVAAVLLVLLVVVVGAVKVLPGAFASPDKQFIAYQEDLFIDRMLSGLEETLDFYGSGKFSSDLTITGSVDSEEMNRYLKDSSVALKMDLNQDNFLANGELVLMGSPVLSGAFTYDKGKVGFHLPEIDDTYYVMDSSKVLKTLTGQDIDLSGLKVPTISGKEWRSLAQSYLDVVYTVVNKDNVKLEKDATFRLPELDVSCKGNIYTFTPRAQDVEAMLNKLADNLENDKTLRKLIVNLVNPDMLTAAFGEEIFNGYDLETELDEALLHAADVMRTDAAGIGETVEDSGFTWTLYTEGKTVRMIKLETKVSDDSYLYECKGNPSDECTEMFYVNSYGDISSVENTYTQKGDQYQGTVSISASYQGDFSMVYDVNKGKKSALGVPYGSYELSSDSIDMDISLQVGKGDKGGVDHILSIDSDAFYYYGVPSHIEMNINATDKSSAKKPSGKSVDISDYDRSELNQLFTDLGETLDQDLLRNLGPLMYE